MANAAYIAPQLLVDPGYLYWAPVGSAVPTGVSTASAFSDTWPVAWIPLGYTESGTDFDVSVTTSPITAAEVVEPITYRTTDRTGTITFMLKNITATNLGRALNGGVLSVTGTGATTITKITPPVIGTETRCMIGYESLDSTFRFVAYQCFNSGSVKLSFNKAPANAAIPWQANLEKPATLPPFDAWTAGVARG